MQYDMHYYGTYAMAAAAGIPKQDAQIIATAAQFVDDHNFTSLMTARSGEAILGVATAHHPIEAGVRAVNIGEDDSRLIWVPFHFLPGNIGTSFHERLVAQKDSTVANAMLDYYLAPDTMASHHDHALQLMGIAAHVYADTFSHYGFSGVPSDLNLVLVNSIEPDPRHSSTILAHLKNRYEQFTATFGGMPSLGHGAVATFPDRPYLRWTFRYANGVTSARSNPDTFLEGCAALFKRFCQFREQFYPERRPTAEWDDLRGPANAVLVEEGTADERVGFWLSSMESADLPGVAPCDTYNHEQWQADIEHIIEGDDAAALLASPVYHFFAAAEYHRNYVLKRLLPSFGLLVA